MSGKTLLIVESPNKAKSIQKMLGSKYIVKSSLGHIRDLPESNDDGLTPENKFQPKYDVLKGKVKTVNDLKKSMKYASKIVLATDADREGEAIAWHLSSVLNVSGVCRAAFGEITKKVILRELDNLREIDYQMVRSQEARRAIDRIIGYVMSPYISNKMGVKGLSMGRVQTVFLRLVVDRQRQIDNFESANYYAVSALHKGIEFKWVFSGYLSELGLDEDGNKIPKRWTDKEFAESIVGKVKSFTVSEITTEEKKERPKPPLITSTMCQVAPQQLGWSVKKTMEVAQKLFDEHMITYHRTDSVEMSEEAIEEIRQWLNDNDYDVPDEPQKYRVDKNAQEGHECVRPTDIAKADAKHLGEEQDELYQIILKYAICSQMTNAIKDVQKVEVESDAEFDESGHFPGGKVWFSVSGISWKEKGYKKLFGEKTDDVELPKYEVGDVLEELQLELHERKTNPPSPYKEATLMKAIERKGVGRPATFAATIASVTRSKYWKISRAKKTKGSVTPTELGKFVIDSLVGDFAFLEYGYTADLEKEFGDIANGKDSYIRVVESVFKKLKTEIKEKKSKGFPIIPSVVKEEIAKNHKPKSDKD